MAPVTAAAVGVAPAASAARLKMAMSAPEISAPLRPVPPTYPFANSVANADATVSVDEPAFQFSPAMSFPASRGGRKRRPRYRRDARPVCMERTTQASVGPSWVGVEAVPASPLDAKDSAIASVEPVLLSCEASTPSKTALERIIARYSVPNSARTCAATESSWVADIGVQELLTRWKVLRTACPEPRWAWNCTRQMPLRIDTSGSMNGGVDRGV